MKKLIIINGTMGVGKTTVCKKLYQKLNNSVWLDGDWCWMMNPFIVTKENKEMVIDNITHILNNYLKNSTFEYIIFNWVIHQKDIFNIILDKLAANKFKLYKITLICSKEDLEKRILKDNRKEKIIKKSLERLELYKKMNTIKINTTGKNIEETITIIMRILND